MKVGKNKLTGFIIVLLLFALGCEADTYDTNREEFSNDVLRIAPTASVITAIIKNTGSVVVQSTKTGTVYLVNTTVTVSNIASITGAAGNQWNSVAISSPSTNTNLAATGLAEGTYKAYAVDAAGNLSGASNNSVIVDNTPPTVSSVAITDAEGVQNGFVNAGDNVSVTATFREAVIVDNSSGNPTITLVVGSTNRTATYASGDNSTDLVFRLSLIHI